jgi:hypothetical protein
VYAALWRILPGPVWVRLLILLIAFAAILFCLVTWVFPWVDSVVNTQEVTVHQ